MENGGNVPGVSGGAGTSGEAGAASGETTAPRSWDRYKYIYPPNARGQE